jgi:hypothetical protein
MPSGKDTRAMARHQRRIQNLDNAVVIIAAMEGIPVCDCCGSRLASINYDSDNLCVECASDLVAAGEPVARYGRQITPRR